MRRRLRAVRLAAPFAALALAACGYTFGSGLRERGLRTVALTLVGNETWRQRLEVELSAALARELPVSTDLRLATAAQADATLEVTIAEAKERTLVPGATPVLEGTLAAAVSMRLVGRDGKPLLERVLLDRTEFRDPIGENLTSARAELANDLARKIALALDGRALRAGTGR
ncbi:MAG: hypothetical protein KDE27_05320 [Planctomycetes bacterium]|nr:hypothetical protein [Planctomycetota bacterium]